MIFKNRSFFVISLIGKNNAVYREQSKSRFSPNSLSKPLQKLCNVSASRYYLLWLLSLNHIYTLSLNKNINVANAIYISIT